MNAKSKKQMDSITKDFSQAEAWLTTLVIRVLMTSDLSKLRARRQASRDAAKILDQLRSLTPGKAAEFVKTGYIAGREASKAKNKPLGVTDRLALQLLIENIGGRLEDSIAIVGRRV